MKAFFVGPAAVPLGKAATERECCCHLEVVTGFVHIQVNASMQVFLAERYNVTLYHLLYLSMVLKFDYICVHMTGVYIGKHLLMCISNHVNMSPL